jgi:predicted nucleotidyltransferase
MLHNYPEVEGFINKITADFKNIFGENLVSVYLTGSLSTNSYIEGLSDIDIIVVVTRKLEDNELLSLKSWSSSLLQTEELASGLDVSIVEKRNVKFDSLPKDDALELFQGEISYAANALGNSPIVWDQIIKNGITLLGPEPKEIITDVPWDIIKEALRNETLTIQERVDAYFNDIKFRYYVVTTLCRITYTVNNKSYTSKELALHWYLEKYNSHTELINATIAYLKGDKNPLTAIGINDYKIFISEVLEVL